MLAQRPHHVVRRVYPDRAVAAVVVRLALPTGSAAVSGLDRARLRLDRVRAAVGKIDPVFLDTPALPCAPLGRALGCSVTLKVETLNPVRRFKGRGTETVAAVAREEREPRSLG